MEKFDALETAERMRTLVQRAQNIRESYTTEPREASSYTATPIRETSPYTTVPRETFSYTATPTEPYTSGSRGVSPYVPGSRGHSPYTIESREQSAYADVNMEYDCTNEVQDLSMKNRDRAKDTCQGSHDGKPKLPFSEYNNDKNNNSNSTDRELRGSATNVGPLPLDVIESKLPVGVAELGHVTMGMKLNVMPQQQQQQQQQKQHNQEQEVEDPSKTKPGKPPTSPKRPWHHKNASIEPGVYRNFEIVTGGGGFRKLKYEEMLYSVNRITPDQNKVYWRCANRKCNGRVTTQNYEIVGATDHSLEAHSGGAIGSGGGVSHLVKTVKQQLQRIKPSPKTSKASSEPPPSSSTTPTTTTAVMSSSIVSSGVGIQSQAPSMGHVHAPNPYVPLVTFNHTNKKTPTPPRDNLHQLGGQGQASQGQVVTGSKFKFGANRKKTPTPPTSPNKFSHHYAAHDAAARINELTAAKRTGTPPSGPYSGSHLQPGRPPPLPPGHLTHPRPRQHNPRVQQEYSPRACLVQPCVGPTPVSTSQQSTDTAPEDLTRARTLRAEYTRECEYNLSLKYIFPFQFFQKRKNQLVEFTRPKISCM